MLVTVVTRTIMPWILLVYRVPREPSAPRIAIWRRLRRLGVAQLGDGTVALPEDARTREQLEWVADEVVEAGGTALLWRAQTLAASDEKAIAMTMAAARAAEYAQVIDQADAVTGSSSVEQRRAVKRLRRELRAIRRRDHFPPGEAERAVAAVASLAEAANAPAQVASGSRPEARGTR
jgi:hypothetical protein